VSIRNIAVFTGSRSEYGLLSQVVKSIFLEPSLEVSLIVSGSHLLDEYGKTVWEIDKSCVNRIKKIAFNANINDKEIETLLFFSNLVSRGANVLTELRPDIIVLAGDRYETFAMATTAFYLNIPIAHISGGDLSLGGHFDDSVRHSITKLSHLHFATNDDSYKRILSLGEEPWRVFNVGSTAIDNILSSDCLAPKEIANEFNVDLAKPIIVFTQHPITTEADLSYSQTKESLEALNELSYQTIITYPSNDSGSDGVIKAIEEFSNNPNFRIRKSLGWKSHLGLLKVVSVVVGNSSSGIIETPILKLPCVDIGTRQLGRLRSENVIDTPNKKEEIKKAIKKAINDKKFVERVKNCSNPYGEGGASKQITNILKSISLHKSLLQKKMTFC